MITEINTTEAVKEFAKQIIAEGVSFHTDDDFNDYVVFKTSKPFYTNKQAEIRNKCFTVCENEGTDIYGIMLEVTLIETGMDKFIPLPSHSYQENN
jgi:hypothetical protein